MGNRLTGGIIAIIVVALLSIVTFGLVATNEANQDDNSIEVVLTSSDDSSNDSSQDVSSSSSSDEESNEDDDSVVVIEDTSTKNVNTNFVARNFAPRNNNSRNNGNNQNDDSDLPSCANSGNNGPREDCSSVKVTAQCVAHVATFTIENTGELGEGDMKYPSEWRLYVNDDGDDDPVKTDTFQLKGGETLVIEYDEGGEVRLEADQLPYHPGNSKPRETLDCGDPPPPEPPKIRPILECVEPLGDEMYRAHFGYLHEGDAPYDIPFPAPSGHRNDINGQDMGQPITFHPGRTDYYPNAAFTVDFDGSGGQKLVWTLGTPGQGTRTSTASDNPAQLCKNHIYLEKVWLDAQGSETDVPQLPDGFAVTATSEIDEITCSYVNDVWTCDKDGELSVPVNGTYTVVETNVPDGYEVVSGVSDGAFAYGDACEIGYEGLDKNCLHTVVNQEQSREFVCDSLYYVNHIGNNLNDSPLFRVNLVDDKALLTHIADFDFDQVHIGASLDGEFIYGFDEDGNGVQIIDVNPLNGDDSVAKFGPTLADGKKVKNITQVAFSPTGKLYIGSAGTDEIYLVDVDVNAQTVSATSLGKVTKSGTTTTINIGGADIAFGSDGSFYLMTRTDNTIYDVDLGTMVGTVVGSPGKSTGLAILDEGAGDFVYSNSEADEIVKASRANATILDEYEMYFEGSPYDAIWGDMSGGCIPELPEPDIDLEIVKEADTDTVYAGDAFTYTLEVTNYSEVAVSNAVVTDPIPDTLTYVSASVTVGSGACEFADDTVTCTIDSLPALDGSATIEIIVEAKEIDKESLVVNNVAVVEHPGDTDDDDDDVTVVAGVVDFSIEKTIVEDASAFMAGDNFTYKIEITNDGKVTATDIVMTDVFPVEIIPGAVNAPAEASCSKPDAQTVECLIASLAPNESIVITVDATVADVQFDGDELVVKNTAVATNPDLEVDDDYDVTIIKPNPYTCVPNSIYDYAQGTTKGGGTISANRSNPSLALTIEDDDTINFFSLGFGDGRENGSDATSGWLIYDFGENNVIFNVLGDDLVVFETSFGDTNKPWENYPEQAEIYASQDAVNWVLLGVDRKDMTFDLGSLDWARYIMVVDVSDITSNKFGSSVDAFDLDGVSAADCGEPPEPPPPASCKAFEVVDYSPVKEASIAPGRKDPNQGLFAEMVDGPPINFVSLGGDGGEITIAPTDGVLYVSENPNLHIWETTYGEGTQHTTCDSYYETASVWVYGDTGQWVEAGSGCRDFSVNLTNTGLTWISEIKIVDTGDNRTPDGYDFDGLTCAPAEPEEPEIPYEICEMLFYSHNPAAPNQSWLYGVYLNEGTGKAEMYLLEADTGFGDSHIAASPDGDKVYFIENKHPHRLGIYDVETGVMEDKGSIGVAGVTQAALHPFTGVLYIGSANTNKIYTVDLNTAAATEVNGGFVKTQGGSNVNINGADIAFADDGTFYLATRATNKIYEVNLDTMEIVDTVAMNAVMNGMTIENYGSGPFVYANREDDGFVRLDTNTNTSQLFKTEDEFDIEWGDMASCISYDAPEPTDDDPKEPPAQCDALFNHVTNGSFEDPVLDKNWDIFTSDEMPRWNVEWNVPGIVCQVENKEPVLEYQRSQLNLATPVDGNQYAELDSDCQGPGGGNNGPEEVTTTIWQEIITKPGKNYTFEFSAQSRRGAMDFVAKWGGNIVVNETLNHADGWIHYSLNVQATASTTVISFSDEGDPDSFGIFLDAVAVYENCDPPPPPPPPPTICEVGTGLGIAADFNVFAFGNFNSSNSDTGGRMAIGGNATLTGYGVGTELDSNIWANQDVLIVGGNLDFSNGKVYYGNAVVGGSANVAANGTIDGALINASPINFPDAEAALKALSGLYASYVPNGTTTFANPVLNLVGTNPNVNIFNVSGADIGSASTLNIDVPNGSLVIINVDGATVDVTNMGLENGINASHILYNFYDATTLNMSGVGVHGSVLAPYAHVNFNNGQLYGTLVAASFEGNGELHIAHFEGCIEEPPPQCTSENRDPNGDLKNTKFVYDYSGDQWTVKTTVTNISDVCDYEVGMASYEMVGDRDLKNQILHDWEPGDPPSNISGVKAYKGEDGDNPENVDGIILKPGEEHTFMLNIPQCASQVDLFFDANEQLYSVTGVFQDQFDYDAIFDLVPLILPYFNSHQFGVFGDRYNDDASQRLLDSNKNDDDKDFEGDFCLPPPPPQCSFLLNNIEWPDWNGVWDGEGTLVDVLNIALPESYYQNINYSWVIQFYNGDDVTGDGFIPVGTTDHDVEITYPAPDGWGESENGNGVFKASVALTFEDELCGEQAWEKLYSDAWEIDLAIEKSGPETVYVGESFDYTLVGTNNSDVTSMIFEDQGTIITDELPEALTFNSASWVKNDVEPATACDYADGMVTCDVGELAPDDVATVTINVTAPDETGEILNIAEITPTLPDVDINLDDNTDSQPTEILTRCIPDPEVHLSGIIEFDAQSGKWMGTVTNISEYCRYEVGMAAYQRYGDGGLDSQVLHDSDPLDDSQEGWFTSPDPQGKVVEPNDTIELMVMAPECAAQLDLFYDASHYSAYPDQYDETQWDLPPLVLPIFNSNYWGDYGNRYGERLLDAKLINNGDDCADVVELPVCEGFDEWMMTESSYNNISWTPVTDSLNPTGRVYIMSSFAGIAPTKVEYFVNDVKVDSESNAPYYLMGDNNKWTPVNGVLAIRAYHEYGCYVEQNIAVEVSEEQVVQGPTCDMTVMIGDQVYTDSVFEYHFTDDVAIVSLFADGQAPDRVRYDIGDTNVHYENTAPFVFLGDSSKLTASQATAWAENGQFLLVIEAEKDGEVCDFANISITLDQD